MWGKQKKNSSGILEVRQVGIEKVPSFVLAIYQQVR